MADHKEDAKPEADNHEFEVESVPLRLPAEVTPEQEKALKALDELAMALCSDVHCYDEAVACADKCKSKLDKAHESFLTKFNIDIATCSLEDFYNRCRLYSVVEEEEEEEEVKPRRRKKASKKKKSSKKTAGSRKRLLPIDKAKAVKRVVKGNMLGRDLDRAVAKELKISSDKINQQWYIVRIAGLNDFSLKVTSDKRDKQQKFIDRQKTIDACNKAINKLSK